MRPRTLPLLLALLASPALLQAQQDDPRLARLEPEARATVAAAIARAGAEGLPAEPLVDKALEGASKGVDGARIAAAVDRLARDLSAARDALGGRAMAGELVAGAAALRAGAAPEALATLRRTRAEGALTVPLATLADLVARGVPVETAYAVIQGLAERGVGDAGFVALRERVERDIGAGVPPAAAATVRGQGKGPPESVVPPGRAKDKENRGRGNSVR